MTWQIVRQQESATGNINSSVAKASLPAFVCPSRAQVKWFSYPWGRKAPDFRPG